MSKLKLKKIAVLSITAIFVGSIAIYLTHPPRVRAAFPSTAKILDNFNRADVATLASATASSGYTWADTMVQSSNFTQIGINNNQLYDASSNNNGYLNAQFGPDSEVYVDVPTLPANGQYTGLYARLQDPGNGGANDQYGLIYFHSTSGNASWDLWRYDNNVPVHLSDISAPAISAGDSLGFSVTGTGGSVTLTAYRKTSGTWSTVGNVNDTSPNRIISAGYIGIDIDSGVQRLDNFGGGTLNTSPSVPLLSSPADLTTGESTAPQFSFSSTDADSDYLRYKVEICSVSDCSTVLRTADQTVSQTGWSNQDTQSGTAYSSGSTATYTYQAPLLSPGTQYWWRAYSIDPGGINAFSPPSAIRSFTTAAATSPPTPAPATNGGTGFIPPPAPKMK